MDLLLLVGNIDRGFYNTLSFLNPGITKMNIINCITFHTVTLYSSFKRLGLGLYHFYYTHERFFSHLSLNAINPNQVSRHLLHIYVPTPPDGQDVTQGQFFLSGV